MCLLGVVNGCVGVGDKIAEPMEVWTTDGLYVGGLFDRRADDGLPDRVCRWWVAGELHLCWESLSQSVEHVPRSCLYPPR